ncbi:MAG: methyltransferase domain-containing protein [Planctomycetes bacterium]|nr:methyltransferase domain-containing protein [Planctomycetota bacterium]
MLTPLECYELCVQSPRHVVAFLYAAHGAQPLVLREDFCGSAAIGRRWAAEGKSRGDESRAIGIDLDPTALQRATEQAGADGVEGRLQLVAADATGADAPADAADVIFVGNFSIGYIHDRTTLVAYLAACLDRLRRGNCGFGGGIFACDTYGGAGAFKKGSLTRRHPSRGGEIIHYHWSHDAADPLTGIVENSISFRVESAGEIVAEYPNAFTYRWRLWSIAELREAMMEVGFTSTDVYTDVNIAPGQTPAPVESPEQLGEDWIVVVTGRA